MGKTTALILIIEWAILKILITLAIPVKFILNGIQEPQIAIPLFFLTVMKLKEITGKIDKPITQTTEKLKNNESIKSIIDSHIPKESETNA